MARPNKEGLEYFPLDTKFDEEILLIDAKFGCEGIGILIKIWQIIYDNGYYIKWTERELLLYKNRINADINLVNEIVNECIKWGIFDNNLFKKHNILTSRGIQKRFLEATKRRKEVQIENTFCLINNVKDVNANIIIVNAYNNSKNAYKSTQTEIETESKQKQFDLFWKEYPNKKSKKKAQESWNKIKNPDMGLILEAVKKQKKTQQWMKDNGQFIPMPSTWLNQERWNDEIKEVQGERRTKKAVMPKEVYAEQ